MCGKDESIERRDEDREDEEDKERERSRHVKRGRGDMQGTGMDRGTEHQTWPVSLSELRNMRGTYGAETETETGVGRWEMGDERRDVRRDETDTETEIWTRTRTRDTGHEQDTRGGRNVAGS